MSSTIKLYEHNQNAYAALLDMLGERDRACIIKPTGTGKFVIIAKMVQDNPDKRFLLLGTNDYMFNDQMANLAEIAPGFTPENLQFMTYSAAMMAARRGEEISGYDVVVADEFHHCGAEEWGKGVTHILDANESAKVVGFSATPIRYSDGGRNMADEMFDGNVAYSMELEEAWLRGILPIPEYIVALYNAPSELEKLAKSITTVRDEAAKKRFQKKYEKLRRALTEAGGVRESIAAYLKKADAKVIVFCPRVAKLREFMLLRREWFGAVNGEIHAYKTVSADPYGSTDFQAFKDDESDALKVLYCVNQLNEAVHVNGVDAIVMVRPTKSPTVFYQQLGRVLSSGGNRTPLVFDLCNNFSSITATEGNLCRGRRGYRLQRRIRPRVPIRRRGAPEGGRTHHGHHEPVHVVHGKALQVGGCRRPHRIRVDGQGTRFACRRARDACRAAMARTMARSRVDTCLGRVKHCFSHALIFAAQVCAIYVVILLSGLLVFWSAIFIDSKGRKFSRQEDSRILRKHHREIGKTMAINRVTIMGNLTRDAELRKKGDATSVLTFGLAINEKKKDSETGEYVDAPVFVDCALFGARAEALAPYLTKGKKVSVDGRLRYHSWMKNEEKRHALSVLVTDIEFADSKGAGKDTVSAKGQSAEPETYDADIPF